jgi:hypothetical protein
VSVSFSKLDLLKRCQYWAGPNAVDVPRLQSASASEGTIFHELIETHLRCEAREAPDERTAERFLGWVDAWSALYGDAKVRAVEASYALSVSDGAVEFLGESLGRRYPKTGEGWICGTIDAAVEHNGELVVIDHKTGGGHGTDWSAIAPAEDNLQLRAGAYCVAKHLGYSRARIELHHVQQSGAIEVDSAEVDAIDLAGFPQIVRELLAAVDSSRPQPGNHCVSKFCNQITECPASRDAAGKLIPVTNLTASIVSPEQLAKAVDALPAAKRLLRNVEQAMKQYCEESGGCVELPDGRKYRAIENKGRVGINAAAVRRDHGDKYDRQGAPYISFKAVGKRRPEKELSQ